MALMIFGISVFVGAVVALGSPAAADHDTLTLSPSIVAPGAPFTATATLCADTTTIFYFATNDEFGYLDPETRVDIGTAAADASRVAILTAAAPTEPGVYSLIAGAHGADGCLASAEATLIVTDGTLPDTGHRTTTLSAVAAIVTAIGGAALLASKRVVRGTRAAVGPDSA